MKSIPMRMCVVCREMKPKKELLRIVLNKDGSIVIDVTGKANGRGAYVCDNDACINRCVKTKALNRNFATEVSAVVYEKLKEEYAKHKM